MLNSTPTPPSSPPPTDNSLSSDPPLLIQNPHQFCPKLHRVQGDIDFNIFKYFFLHILAGNHGVRQSLICIYFNELYKACLAAEIPERYDELIGHQRIAEVVSRLNFRDVDEECRRAYDAGVADSAIANSEPSPTATLPRPRRSNKAAPKPTT